MSRHDRGTSSQPRLPWPSMAAVVESVRRALRAPSTPGLEPPLNFSRPFPHGLRVMVADDNPSHLGHARDLLGTWAITPTVAADGAEAVALACKRRFDVILMDLRMPVLDGLVATKKIRRFEHEQSCPRTPVLAYTSHPVHEQLWRHYGLDGTLAKPCTTHVLHACLVHWCGPGSSPSATAMDLEARPR